MAQRYFLGILASVETGASGRKPPRWNTARV